MKTKGQIAQEKGDRIYSQIIERLTRLGLSDQDVHRVMSMVAEYGNAEIEAESFCNQ